MRNGIKIGSSSEIKRLKVEVSGIVQGVGFRPFVYGLAQRLSLSGHVSNGAAGVTIEVEGESGVIENFLWQLANSHPPLAAIESVKSIEIPVQHSTEFVIAASGTGTAPVAPDSNVCPDCLEELFNPEDRRYRYPFINCTNCGPRFSIITRTPYDRPNTTMAEFDLCPDCRREYCDPLDRRFHAQPVACPLCGPRLIAIDSCGAALEGDPLSLALQSLANGGIVAVKGVGGFHLAVDPFNEAAVTRLRARKLRDEKPFALLVASLADAANLVSFTEIEGRLLESQERPILLLPRRDDCKIAPNVSPANGYLGVMLPSNPLQYLLLEGGFSALVMTSANLSGEPVISRTKEALRKLGNLADLFLTHNRRIFEPSDDSVIRVFRSQILMMRRSRGYIPRSIRIPPIEKSVFAAGGELKSAICLANGAQAWPGRHIGDLKAGETLAEYGRSLETMKRVSGEDPQIAAFDSHPDYLSTHFARKLGLPGFEIQHHHAHLASCMAENLLEGELIGLIFDGTGLGDDGSIWGGEFLVGGYSGYRRAGHLRHMRLPGGDAAAEQPWRMAASLLWQIHGDRLFEFGLPCLAALSATERGMLLKMLERGINSPVSSSCGRLFDAVAAIIGLRQSVSYEGQAAIELEGLADSVSDSSDSCFDSVENDITEEEGRFVLDWRAAIDRVLQGVLSAVPAAELALGFHRWLALASAEMVQRISAQSGYRRVALSGGVFQNRLLCEELVSVLEKAGFEVYTHRLVPPNDGGLSLGQAMIAGRRDLCA